MVDTNINSNSYKYGLRFSHIGFTLYTHRRKQTDKDIED